MEVRVGDIVTAVDGELLCGDPETVLRHISIDSRAMKGQDLFVPLIGERSDAHDYIGQALENGAAASLTSRPGEMDANAPHIRVADTKEALQDIGRFLRGRLRIPLIGITGSVGKTTTREMVTAALSAGYRVFRTPANQNSQVGVPISISEIGRRDEIGVLELGMSEPGELTVIAQIARVHMAVITNIGVAHIEQLGSQENICREKLTIQDGLEPGGVLFLNGDDPMLCGVRARDGFETVYYGTGAGCSYRAADIREDEEGYPSFTACHMGRKVPVRLRVMGRHNVLNAMVSLAVAHRQGIPMEAAAESLSGYTGYQNRQQIFCRGGVTVIDDTYNASPVSMKAGLQVLNSMRKGLRKVAVLADMKELGPQAPAFHREVGAYAATLGLDWVVTYGELASCIGDAVREANPGVQVRGFGQKEELVRFLDGLIGPGDCVLFKGSNSMRLGEVAARYL